jgi:hypothetical protein
MPALAESYQSSYFQFDQKKGAILNVVPNPGSHKNNEEFYLDEELELITSSIDTENETTSSSSKYQPKLKITPVPSPVTNESFIEIKKWEGKIISIDLEKELFQAEIRDAKTPEIEEETYFSFDDIDENDRHLISEGAIFYWSIGYKRTNSGGREKVSILLLRRLPAWNINQKKIDERINNLSKILANEQTR